MDEIIRTENLSKYYADVHAVSGLSLNVSKGEIYGFLGLNGAGKTTTIRMLLGMIRPTSGTAFMKGKKVYADNTELWKKVGSLVETPYSYPDLTVHENLEIIHRLRFLSDKKSIDRVIDKLQLGTYSNRKVKNLSLGNAQRLGIAKAIMHNPEILILDEPSNGLDPSGILEMRDMISDLSLNQGVTVFISSHILSEISKLANRIGIIHEGKLLQEVDAGQLEKLSRKRLLIKANDIKSAATILNQSGFALQITSDDIIELNEEAAIEKPDVIATILVNAGCPPTLLQVVEEDLETYFLRAIEKKGGAK